MSSSLEAVGMMPLLATLETQFDCFRSFGRQRADPRLVTRASGNTF